MTGSQPTHNVKVVKNVLITMDDGVLIAADLFMPDSPGTFPAIVESYPYRKDDLAAGMGAVHRYLARCGYVALHVDVRGSGMSAGVCDDEYTVREQLDLVAVIAWAAAQPWCSGVVGM